MGLKDWFRNWVGLNEFGAYGLNELRFQDGTPDFNEYGSDIDKLNIVLSNPACLKVFALQMDLFSLGKIYVYKNGKAVDKDPFLDMIKNPNPFQSESQLKRDFMFWNMLGNSYTFCDSAIVGDNKIYLLEVQKMNFPQEMQKYKDKIVLSNTSQKTLADFNIKYNYSTGETTELKWGKIIHNPDLTNGTGNWFKGNSRLSALYKVISNSEAALNSKNTNVRYAGKYMVAGTTDRNNPNELPLTDTEKSNIETKVHGNRPVTAVKSMIDIKRYVENIANLKLDESYWADYFIIGGMYNIPKDVLEWYLTGGTWENQEKARMSHVSYSLEPKGNAWMEGFAKHFGYTEKGLEIVMSWDHLPFMQISEKDRAETQSIKAQTLLALQQAGVSVSEINKYLDLEFTELNPIRNESTGLQTGQGKGESSTNT